MPTRIALRGTAPSQVTPRFRKKPVFASGLSSAEEDAIQRAATASASRNNSDSNNNNDKKNRIIGSAARASSTTKRSIVGFRSSILRELSVRSSDSRLSDTDTAAAAADGDDERVRVSSQDIRASPRLLGYLFCCTAASVMLASVIQFDRKDTLLSGGSRAKYVTTLNGLVYRWKLWGAIYVAAIGVGSCLLVVLVHFDTFCFPTVWVKVFRDGSLAERNLIFAMLLFWAAGVHICTSSLSVG